MRNFILGVFLAVGATAIAQVATTTPIITQTPILKVSDLVNEDSFMGKHLLSATSTIEGVEYNYKNREIELLQDIDDKLGEIIKELQ